MIKKRNGNVFIGALIFIAIIISIFLFIIGIFLSNVNSILYNLKLEMYSINKSGVIAVNKNKTNIDDFSYSEKEYRKYFKDMLQKNYELNEDLENKDKLITKIEIKEYKIYKSGKKDSYTNAKVKDNVLHTIIKVKIKPIIMASVFEEIFIFEIHEDVNLNLLKT